MSAAYRILFETVWSGNLKKYMNADPAFYSHVTQTVPNSQIPDEDWHEVIKETDNPWQQFSTLSLWAAQDKEFIRNVRLERLVRQPEWQPVSREELISGNLE